MSYQPLLELSLHVAYNPATLLQETPQRNAYFASQPVRRCSQSSRQEAPWVPSEGRGIKRSTATEGTLGRHEKAASVRLLTQHYDTRTTHLRC